MALEHIADGPARRAASRESCYTQTLSLSVTGVRGRGPAFKVEMCMGMGFPVLWNSHGNGNTNII